MRTIIALIGACVVALARAPAAPELDPIQFAADALGANTIKTMRFVASGATFSVGQNFKPTDPWPRVTVKHYAVLIDYETGGIQQDLVREMGRRCLVAAGCRSRAKCVRSKPRAPMMRGTYRFPRSGGTEGTHRAAGRESVASLEW
jgi:hypothetical protein